MYHVIVRGLLLCLLVLCHHASAQDSPQRRWVKINHQTLKLPTGEPAFVLVLRGQEESCGQQREKDECLRHWRALPDRLPPPLSDEAEYWDDYEFGPERTRVNKESFCLMTASKNQVLVSCNERWEILVNILRQEREAQKNTSVMAIA